jgi:hypothetical protein
LTRSPRQRGAAARGYLGWRAAVGKEKRRKKSNGSSDAFDWALFVALGSLTVDDDQRQCSLVPRYTDPFSGFAQAAADSALPEYATNQALVGKLWDSVVHTLSAAAMRFDSSSRQ